MHRPLKPSPSNPPEQEDETPVAAGPGSIVFRLALPLLILILCGLPALWLSREAPPQAEPSPSPQPLEVRVVPLQRQDYQIHILAQGLVQAHSQVSLTAQVAGRVQTIHAPFEVGAFFQRGDVLLELDPVDFEAAVKNARAQMAQATFNLELETVRAQQAKLNWDSLGYDDEPGPLVLRLPHVKLAQSQLEGAEAQVLGAERDLARSKVRAPFDGRVLTRNVGVGQTIGGGTELGVIFATDYSEVRLPVPTRFLPDLALPEDTNDPPLAISLQDGLGERPDLRWEASIVRTEGALDANTLELFAIARIPDPFGRSTSKIPLRVGQPVSSDIPGRTLESVFVIPRDAVIGLDRIRLADPDTLTLMTAEVSPLWTDEDALVFRDSVIPDGTYLVTTRLLYAPDGGQVVLLPDEMLPESKETS